MAHFTGGRWQALSGPFSFVVEAGVPQELGGPSLGDEDRYLESRNYMGSS